MNEPLVTFESRELAKDRLGSLVAEKVYFQYDGVLFTYIARDPDGELLLLHLSERSGTMLRYLVAPIGRVQLEMLEAGTLELRQALDQSRLWMADIGPEGVEAIRIPVDREQLLPFLPQPGVLLDPDHEPLLSIRALGPTVHLHGARLGLLHAILDRLREALKTLAKHAGSALHGAAVRPYYDLTTVLTPGSITVSVMPPKETQRTIFEDDTWQRMADILAVGLRTIADDQTASTNRNHPTEKDVLVALQTMRLLAPPATGEIDTTELSGSLVAQSYAPHENRVRIDRRMAGRIRERLNFAVEPEPLTRTENGWIRELDLDALTCELRDEHGATIYKLSFDEALLDAVKAAFDTRRKVFAIAETTLPASQLATLMHILPPPPSPSVYR